MGVWMGEFLHCFDDVRDAFDSVESSFEGLGDLGADKFHVVPFHGFFDFESQTTVHRTVG